jgi:tetratricopeptide (TPR) repeat protein
VWLEPFLVKGKSQPIHAALVGRLEGQVAAPGSGALPLVGREQELALLRAALRDLRANHGGVADIVGDAGTGKTRLVEELRRDADLRTITVICGQYARTTPYFVIRLLLRSLAGVELHTSSADAGVALARLVDEHAPHLRPWVPLLAIPFDAEVPPTPESSGVAPAYRRERVHQVVADLLTAVVTTPSMVVVEDAHWIDDASRDLLQLLAEVAVERPWLFCLTRRPDPPLFEVPGGATSLVLRLEPLDAGAALELAVAAAGDESRLRPGDWERLVDRAAGNPMFVIELVSSAVEQGGAEALPESVESLVTARIDTVAAEDRLLLREAAVLGMVVELDLLADALEQDAVRDAARWAPLDAFLAPLAAGRLAFRNGLYRQVAYEGLSYRRRREAHRRVGYAIEVRGVADPDADAELLSTHFHRAGAHDRAWRYSVVAGDRARAKYANVEAAEFYERALDNAPRVPDLAPARLAAVAEALGDVSELAGRYDDAARSYSHARRLLPREGSDAVRLLHKEGVVRERSGRYADALRWYSRGLRVLDVCTAEEREQASLRAELALAYAGVRYRQGRYLDQVRWAERAADDAARVDDRAALAHAYYLLDLGYTSLARPEQCTYRGLALPIYEELGDHVGRCNVLNNLGIVAYHAGRWDDAVESYDLARQAAEQAGDVVGAATGENNIGEILSDQGRIDESVPLFRAALRVFRSAHYPVGVAVATANLGRAEARAGEHAQALALLDEAVVLFEELRAAAFVFDTRVRMVEGLVLAGRHAEALALGDTLADRVAGEGDDLPKVQLVRALGWARLRTGRVDDAIAAFDDSIARAEAIDARYERALSQVGRAEASRAAGDAERADGWEADARRVLDELGVVAVPRVP